MIVFDLTCSAGHVFEGWFGSSADFDDQGRRGLLRCPICDSDEVGKAPMAPRLAVASPDAVAPPADPAQIKKMMAQLAEMQKQILRQSEHVGDRFAAEARAIHLGESDARAIHGRATRAQTDSLIEDGIPVAPLPFPVVEPGEEN